MWDGLWVWNFTEPLETADTNITICSLQAESLTRALICQTIFCMLNFKNTDNLKSSRGLLVLKAKNMCNCSQDWDRNVSIILILYRNSLIGLFMLLEFKIVIVYIRPLFFREFYTAVKMCSELKLFSGSVLWAETLLRKDLKPETMWNTSSSVYKLCCRSRELGEK